MTVDAFIALDEIRNDESLSKQERDAAIQYIEYVIYLQYNKQARDELEKLLLSMIS